MWLGLCWLCYSLSLMLGCVLAYTNIFVYSIILMTILLELLVMRPYRRTWYDRLWLVTKTSDVLGVMVIKSSYLGMVSRHDLWCIVYICLFLYSCMYLFFIFFLCFFFLSRGHIGKISRVHRPKPSTLNVTIYNSLSISRSSHSPLSVASTGTPIKSRYI